MRDLLKNRLSSGLGRGGNATSSAVGSAGSAGRGENNGTAGEKGQSNVTLHPGENGGASISGRYTVVYNREFAGGGIWSNNYSCEILIKSF